MIPLPITLTSEHVNSLPLLLGIITMVAVCDWAADRVQTLNTLLDYHFARYGLHGRPLGQHLDHAR